MSALLRVPELTAETVDADRPISSIAFQATAIPVQRIVGATVNGVDVIKYLGAIESDLDKSLLFLGNPLLRGSFDISIAERVITDSGIVIHFGSTWSAISDYTGPVPAKFKPYRAHDSVFLDAVDKINSMDETWRNHSDSAVVKSILESYREQSFDFYSKLDQIKTRTYLEDAEEVERGRIASVTFTGAIGQKVPYRDVQKLFLSDTSFEYGYDFIITSGGIPVFFSDKCPGRVNSSAVAFDDSFAVRPTSGYAAKSTLTLNNFTRSAVFSETQDKLYGFDFSISPPQNPDDVPLTGFIDELKLSDKVGKIFFIHPRTGEKIFIYNASTNPEKFNGSVTFDQPISLMDGESITFSQDRSEILASNIYDVDPDIVVQIWLNKKITLLGPDYNIKVGSLSNYWQILSGCKPQEDDLKNKISVAAMIKCRTEKSTAAFEELVESSIGIPRGPHKGFIEFINQPDPSGFYVGQIGISGSVLEFLIPATLSAEVGDTVHLLDRLIAESDGVTIEDYASNPLFLGSPGSVTADQEAYLRSKLAGALSVPIGESVPGFTEPDYIRELVKLNSWRIIFGPLATAHLLSSGQEVQEIFECIDKVKPSGTDYYMVLSDGTAIIRNSGKLIKIDISSKLDLLTDYSNRMFNGPAGDLFNTAQFLPASAGFTSGVPIAGDSFRLFVSDSSNAINIVDSITTTDVGVNPLSPEDEMFKRMASAFNSSAPFNTYLSATAISRAISGSVKLKFTPLQTPMDSFVTSIDTYKLSNNPVFSFNKAGGLGRVIPFPIAESPLIPYDLSKVFLSNDEAIGIINSYRDLDLTVTNLSDVIQVTETEDIQDNDAGPFDPDYLELTSGDSRRLYSEDIEVDSGDTFVAARSSLHGTIALALHDDTHINAHVKITGGNPLSTGDTLTVQFTRTTAGPTIQNYPETPIVLTADENDFDWDSMLSRLSVRISADIDLSQFFYVQFSGASGGYLIKIKPIDPTTSAEWTVTMSITGGNSVDIKHGSAGASVVYQFYQYASDITLSSIFSYSVNGGSYTPIKPNPTVFSNFNKSVEDSVGGKARQFAVGGNNFHSFDMKFSRKLFNGPAAPLKFRSEITYTSSPGTFELSPMLRIFFLKMAINDYPEFGRDDDEVILLSDSELNVSRLGSFGYSGELCIPEKTAFPVTASAYSRTYTTLDATSRINAQNVTLLTGLTPRDITTGYDETEIHIDGPFSTLTYYTVKVNGCSSGDITCHYFPGSTRLYSVVTSGPLTTYIPLVVGVDYDEEVPSPGSPPGFCAHRILLPASFTGTAFEGGAVTQIAGFVKSVDGIFHFQGPNATKLVFKNSITQAPGFRALMPESVTPGSDDFRTVNLTAYDPSYNATLNILSDWKASPVSKNRAFGLDDDAFRLSVKLRINKGLIR